MSSYYLIIYVVAFIGIFYFMAIRPQQRQRRAHQALLSSLKRGDTVATAAGIYGKVKRVEDTWVEIEVAKGVTMKVARRAIAEIIRDAAQARALSPGGSTTGRGKRAQAEIEEASAEEIESDATDVSDAGDDESTQS